MRITDEQIVEWLADWLPLDDREVQWIDALRELQEARAKITSLEASLTIKDYLFAELQMRVQALEYRKEKLCATQGETSNE